MAWSRFTWAHTHQMRQGAFCRPWNSEVCFRKGARERERGREERREGYAEVAADVEAEVAAKVEAQAAVEWQRHRELQRQRQREGGQAEGQGEREVEPEGRTVREMYRTGISGESHSMPVRALCRHPHCNANPEDEAAKWQAQRTDLMAKLDKLQEDLKQRSQEASLPPGAVRCNWQRQR